MDLLHNIQKSLGIEKINIWVIAALLLLFLGAFLCGSGNGRGFDWDKVLVGLGLANECDPAIDYEADKCFPPTQQALLTSNTTDADTSSVPPAPSDTAEAELSFIPLAPFGDEPLDVALPPAVQPTLSGIGCVGRQLMISFEFGQDVSGDYAALVGGQPLTRIVVPNQPTRLYFIGPAPAQDTRALIELKSQPDNTIVFSESYSVPACRPPTASAQPTAQPNCPPPEFFDPLMNRCRIIGNEQPSQPEPYTPPGGYIPPDY